jgi:hypothetical protein
LWRSVAEKPLSGRRHTSDPTGIIGAKDCDFIARRDVLLAAIMTAGAAAMIGCVLELRAQVVATMCMPGQRMFGESLLLDFGPGGYRFADKRARHSIAARARPDSKKEWDPLWQRVLRKAIRANAYRGWEASAFGRMIPLASLAFVLFPYELYGVRILEV